MSPATTSTKAKPGPVILVGQANVGKSVLFGLLTGEYAWVSNYPGTTVEISRGRMARSGREVVDTPGVNSLSADSEDERVAQDILARETSAVLVQVADSRNLRRALSFTLQLADLKRPTVLVLNFMDEAASAGVKLNISRLEALLGCEVVPMVAVEGRGLGHLRQAIERARVPQVAYEAQPISDFAHPCGSEKLACPAAALCSDSNVSPESHVQSPKLEAAHLQRAQPSLDFGPWTLDSSRPGGARWRSRERWLTAQLPRIWDSRFNGRLSWNERVDAWLRFFPVGLLVMFAVAALLYAGVGIVAGAASDYLTGRLFGGILTPWLAAHLARLGLPGLTDFVAGRYGLFSQGLSYGLGLVLPVLVVFFLLFALLEDSGYLPRLAVYCHRAMERVGLNGKAVVPIILGFGCGTTAVVATRILPTRRERILAALLLALGVPCSAQLGVLLGLVSGLSLWVPVVIFAVVLLQVLWVGKLAARLLPGATPDFVLELPPLRVPRLSNLLRKTALRVRWYLMEAIPIFLLGSVILFLLDRFNLIGALIGAARPVVSGWLGLPAESSIAFVMGFLRRDYGAAGIYALARSGRMDTAQIMVASTTMVLFMPCLANFLMLVKEFGGRVAGRVALVTSIVALLTGGVLRLVLRVL
jgi:ferrous iron transport protein B